MFLCLDDGKLFVTNSDSATLALQAKRNPKFHFEPIEYSEVQVFRARRSPEQQAEVEALAAASRKTKREPRATDSALFNKYLDELMEEL
jgi:hypothetical protein